MTSKKEFVERAWEKHGTIRMRPIDPDRYPRRPGLEGPFRFRSGKVLYYDPEEGRYYDSDSDMYLSNRDFEAHERGTWPGRTNRKRNGRVPGGEGAPPFYRTFDGVEYELYLWEPLRRKKFLEGWRDGLKSEGHYVRLAQVGDAWGLYWRSRRGRAVANPSKWEGFPRHVGGLPYSTLDGQNFTKDSVRDAPRSWTSDALVYWGPHGLPDRRGQATLGITVQKTWGRWEDAFHVIEWIRGPGESYTGRILTGGSREKTIRFLKEGSWREDIANPSKWLEDLNPYSKRYTLQTFSERYWGKGYRDVPRSTRKDFWDDFQFAFHGGLQRYKEETTHLEGYTNPR